MNEVDPRYRGVPERFKEEGVKVDGNELAKIGDVVVAQRDIEGGLIFKGEQRRITDIFIEPKTGSDGHGFTKEIALEGFPGARFNPQRFKKVRRE